MGTCTRYLLYGVSQVLSSSTGVRESRIELEALPPVKPAVNCQTSLRARIFAFVDRPQSFKTSPFFFPRLFTWRLARLSFDRLEGGGGMIVSDALGDHGPLAPPPGSASVKWHDMTSEIN